MGDPGSGAHRQQSPGGGTAPLLCCARVLRRALERFPFVPTPDLEAKG